MNIHPLMESHEGYFNKKQKLTILVNIKDPCVTAVSKNYPIPRVDASLHKKVSSRNKIAEADDQAIQTILLGLPEDIYAAVDSCETAQEIWLRVQQMMKVRVDQMES
ncbi:hypothetical protein Tco_1484402 [Tanacetum coccineum]